MDDVKDIRDITEQLRVAISALRSISNYRQQYIIDNPEVRFKMHVEAQEALKKMGLLH